MSTFLKRSLTILMVGFVAGAASAADWAANNVQVLYGDQYELSGHEEQSI